MERLAKTGLEKLEGEDKAKYIAGVALQAVLSVKDTIGSALQPVPVSLSTSTSKSQAPIASFDDEWNW